MLAQKDCLKANRKSDQTDDDHLTKSEVSGRLWKLLQASSALSFAMRSPMWGDKAMDVFDERGQRFCEISCSRVETEPALAETT